MRKALTSLCMGGVFLAAAGSRASTNYVDIAVSGGSGSGANWANAFTQLWQAVNAAKTGDMIWVAQGTYAPASGTDRTASFAPTGSTSSGVALYGGFTNGMTALAQRDWTNHPTILTGEIQGNGDPTDNAYHIVKAAGRMVLDGFILTNGCANGTSANGQGGALYCNNNLGTLSAVKVFNCAFVGNFATNGGAVYNDNSASPAFSNCVFRGNSATDGGAVKNNSGSSPTFQACRFEYNTATNGGALRTDFNAAPVLTECVFATNTASRGGAVYNYYNADLVINTCEFTGNTATNGGAVYNDAAGSGSDPVFSNCVFRSNLASGTARGGGAVYSADYCSPVYWDCRFLQNTASNFGGAVCSFRGNAGSPTNRFVRCLFAANQGLNGGGAGYFSMTPPTYADCSFAANSASNGYGGAIYLVSGSPGDFATCRFSGNVCSNEGSAVFANSVCPVTMANSVICGNWGAGAVSIWAVGGSMSTFANTLFAGNGSDRHGGGLVMRYSKPFAVVSNCTFAGNVAATYGGAVYMANLTTQSLNIVNSILWDNTAATGGVMYVNGSSATATVTFAYSDVDGGWNGAKVYKANGANVTITDLGGNTNVNPQFSPTLGGTWTSAEIRNPALGQTTLTDTGAIWTANALQGLTIQPNTASALQYLVASNTLTTVTVWGLVTSGGLTPYALRDARLCSTGGRWTPGDVWVKDNVHSPCIDAGDPQAAYWLEPPFNGSRINMGFDGNTAQASKSSPPGTVMTIR